MSAYVLDQKGINLLTLATNAMLELNSRYCASYPLSDSTIEIFGQHTGKLENIYKILYLTNIKAVNGRYHTEGEEFPDYKKLNAWNPNNLGQQQIKDACSTFSCYMYQISEDPVINTPLFKAIADIYKLCTMYYFNRF